MTLMLGLAGSVDVYKRQALFLAGRTIIVVVLLAVCTVGLAGHAASAAPADQNKMCIRDRDLDFALVEPLKMLFKDEVRACGKALGLPDSCLLYTSTCSSQLTASPSQCLPRIWYWAAITSPWSTTCLLYTSRCV